MKHLCLNCNSEFDTKKEMLDHYEKYPNCKKYANNLLSKKQRKVKK